MTFLSLNFMHYANSGVNAFAKYWQKGGEVRTENMGSLHLSFELQI